MTIVDQVYEFTKTQIAPDQKDVAIWILERICEEAYDHAHAHHELGLLYFERNMPDKAQQHLKLASSIDPQNTKFIKDLGDFYQVVRKDSRRALEKYIAVLQLEPNDQHTLLKAGHLHMANRQFDMARQCYEQLISLDPGNTDARSFLGKLDGSSESATAAASTNELYEQAHGHLANGDRSGALSSLQQAIVADPRNATAHNDCAVLSFEQDDKEKALYHYERAVELAPDNTTFLKNLGDFYWVEKGDAKKAMKQYVEVLRLTPSDVEALISCGQICMKLGKNDDAIEFLRRAQQIEPWNETIGQLLNEHNPVAGNAPLPADRDTLYRQAQSKAATGDLAGAIANLKRILAVEPDNALIYNDLGVMNYQAGNMEDALDCYEQALSMAPEHSLFQKNLADFYMMEQGRVEDAMKLYVKVLEKDPQDLECLLACGLVCISTHQYDDARVFFEKVLDLEPWNISAKEALEKVNNASGSKSENAGANPVSFYDPHFLN